LYFDDGSFGHNKNLIELKCPLKIVVYLYGFPNKVGSWNEAICLAYDDPIHGEGFTIWNPLINRAIALENPNFTFSSHRNLMHSHGFGYDPSSNDIKLFKFVMTMFNGTLPFIEKGMTTTTGFHCWSRSIRLTMVTGDPLLPLLHHILSINVPYLFLSKGHPIGSRILRSQLRALFAM
jgi:hypothetical protein